MIRKIIIFALLVLSLFDLTSCNRRSRENKSSRTQKTERTTNIRNEDNTSQRDNTPPQTRGKTVIKMRSQSGVYYVPCKINGVEMNFVFDTGASDITMSLTEALFLYKQGKLSEDDFGETEYYQIADGSVSEGTVVNLKTVTIGDKTIRNVKASIVHNNEAPLLLGQSAPAKFGKISIDYNKKEITFE
jgi:aspartyl protease family protein